MSDKLMELTGMRPESIDCPGDLGGDVDTEKQTLRYDLQVDDQALREGETA